MLAITQALLAGLLRQVVSVLNIIWAGLAQLGETFDSLNKDYNRVLEILLGPDQEKEIGDSLLSSFFTPSAREAERRL